MPKPCLQMAKTCVQMRKPFVQKPKNFVQMPKTYAKKVLKLARGHARQGVGVGERAGCRVARDLKLLRIIQKQSIHSFMHMKLN